MIQIIHSVRQFLSLIGILFRDNIFNHHAIIFGVLSVGYDNESHVVKAQNLVKVSYMLMDEYRLTI